MIAPLAFATLTAAEDAALPIVPGTICVNLSATLCVVMAPLDPERGYLVRCAFDRSQRWYANPAKLRIATAAECEQIPTPF